MQSFESDTQIILLSADSFTLFLSSILFSCRPLDISNLLFFICTVAVFQWATLRNSTLEEKRTLKWCCLNIFIFQNLVKKEGRNAIVLRHTPITPLAMGKNHF